MGPERDSHGYDLGRCSAALPWILPCAAQAQLQRGALRVLGTVTKFLYHANGLGPVQAWDSVPSERAVLFRKGEETVSVWSNNTFNKNCV